MSPVLKKLAAGFVATKAFEKVQEMRRPKQSFVRRNIGKLLFVGLAGGAAAYLFKTGKLQDVVGSSDTSYRDEYPTGPGTAPIPAVDTSSLQPAGV